MAKKTSSFDEFLIATLLADLFDPSGSDDFDFVSRKIIDGLDAHGMIKSNQFEEEADLAA